MVSAVAPGSRIVRCLLLVLIGLGLGVISYPAFTDDADDAFAAGNFQKALEIWLPRAYEGDTEAQFRVALMFDSGKGVVQNAREAAYWFTYAAELGHTGAQYRIGVIHLSGLGAPKDLARALGWWRLAADGGNADAQYGLGRACLYGIGLPKDRTEAITWLKAAAGLGHAQAIRLLKSLGDQGAATSQNRPAVYFRVGASPLHVHASFNRLSPIIDRLSSGALVQLVERRSGWVKVLVGPGFRLWLDGAQLSGDSTRGWRTGAQVKVFAEVSPRDASPVVGEIESGVSLDVLDWRGGWAQIQAPIEIGGWVEALGLVAATETEAVLHAEWRVDDAPFNTTAQKSVVAASSANADVAPINVTQAGPPDSPASGHLTAVTSRDNVAEPLPQATPVVTTRKAVTDAGMPIRDSTKGETIMSRRLRSIQSNTYEWLFSQDNSRYTIELFSATSEVLVRQFIRSHEFVDGVHYFRTQEHGKTWYTVVHGSYKDVGDVRAALRQLPVKLESTRVRRMRELHEWACQHLDLVVARRAKDTPAVCAGYGKV